jgi:hypothetical protein
MSKRPDFAVQAPWHNSEHKQVNLHVCTVHQQYQGTFLLFQNDAQNYKIIGILKQLKFDYRSDMFRFTQEPSSGSYFVLS